MAQDSRWVEVGKLFQRIRKGRGSGGAHQCGGGIVKLCKVKVHQRHALGALSNSKFPRLFEPGGGGDDSLRRHRAQQPFRSSLCACTLAEDNVSRAIGSSVIKY